MAKGSGQDQVGVVRAFVRPAGGGLRARVRRSAVGAPGCATAAGRALADPDGWLAALLDRQGSGRLQTARDLGLLRWRYGAFPAYRALCVDRGGIAIFRLRQSGRVRVAKVCELLVGEGDLRSARQLVGAIARCAAVDLLACSFPSSIAAAGCGFVPTGRGHALMVRPVGSDLVPDPTRIRSWDLSLGDLELI